MAEDKAVKIQRQENCRIGNSIEGISSAKYLVEKGAKVTLLDKKKKTG